MMHLVIGGSGSGKSEYAERIVTACPAELPRYYLATMHAEDAESRERIARHRRIRAGKQFRTVEQPYGAAAALERMECGDKVILLECLSNLVANEIFLREGAPETPAGTASRVASDVLTLRENARHLVVVTDNVFEDGIRYPASTEQYRAVLGEVCCRLAAEADTVTEVVSGCPIPWKG